MDFQKYVIVSETMDQNYAVKRHVFPHCLNLGSTMGYPQYYQNQEDGEKKLHQQPHEFSQKIKTSKQLKQTRY